MSLIGVQLSQKDIVVLVIYKCLKEGSKTPSDIIKENPLSNNLSRTYIYGICKELYNNGYLNAIGNKYKIHYEINSKGLQHYEEYKKEYKKQFEEVKLVIDRIVSDLTGSKKGNPVVKPLPDEYRVFISKLVSVKDIIRYMLLKYLQKKRVRICLKDVEDKLRVTYGWAPSSSYLYDIGYELYQDGLVNTWWKDDKRHMRFYKITDKGVYHYNQIANSTKERALNLQHFMADVLNLF